MAAIATSILHTEGPAHTVTMTITVDGLPVWQHTYDGAGKVILSSVALISVSLLDTITSLQGYDQFINTLTGYCPGVKREPLNYLDVLLDTDTTLLTIYSRIKSRDVPSGLVRRINEFTYSKSTGLLAFVQTPALTVPIADYLAWKTLFATSVRGCQNL